MSIALTGSDIVMLEGDSICDRLFSYVIFQYPLQMVNRQISPLTAPPVPGTWPPTSPGPVKPWPPTSMTLTTTKTWPPAITNKPLPQVQNLGLNGSTTAQLAARIATDLAVAAFTAAFFHIGINDCRTAVATATTITNMTTVHNALVAAGVTKRLWSGPFTNGEKWPTGQNNATIDQSIEDLDTAAATFCAANGWTYISNRQLVYAVAEPLLNTPAPGVTAGPLTTGDSLGIHPFGMAINGGQRLIGNLILTQLSGS